MVVLRIHKRASSVPVGGPSVEDTNFAAQNSFLFSRAAIDSTDALSTASKRNDQQFLRDISAKIEGAPFSQPVVRTVKKAHHHHTHGAGSPLTSRRRSIAVSSVLRPPILTDQTDDDVDYEVRLIAPLTNRLTRGPGRATSVPPLTASTYVPLPVVDRHVIYSTGTVGHVHPGHVLVGGDDAEFYHTPTIYDLEKQPTVTNHYGQKLNPVADLAVRQAHSNLDRIERELKYSGDVILTRPVSPRTVIRRSLSYHGPRSSSVVRTRSPSPGLTSTTSVRRLTRPGISKTIAPGVTDAEVQEYLASTHLGSGVETDLLLAGVHPDLYATHSYRLKAPHTSLPASVRYALPSDVLLLPHNDYKPLPTTNITKKIVSSSSPSVASLLIHSAAPLHHTVITPHVVTIPSVTTHHVLKPPVVPKKVITTPSVPIATAPIPVGLPLVSRPKVSETRRKVRDVLCKVKGDPHYFDY